METYIKDLPGLNRLFHMLLCAVIGFSVLCVQSCKTHEVTTTANRTENRQDSLLSEIRVMKPIGIPESKVNLKIPTESLLNLPPSASYTGKSGQANVKVERDNDTIRVYASCDSLQMLCEYYERELTRIRGQTVETLQTKEQRSTSVETAFKYIFIGFVAGIIITIIIYRKKK